MNLAEIDVDDTLALMLERGRAKRRRAEVRFADAFANLEEKGFAVIENVVPAELCADVLARIKLFLCEASDTRDAVGRFDARALRMADYPNIRGIVQHLEAGQMQAIWDIRLSSGVQSVFEEMYGDNDLLSSTDGFCWMSPLYKGNDRSWLHVDQSHHKLGRRCIQGYVNITSSHDASSGSLYVVPGSHNKHTAMANRQRCQANGKDWFKFNDEERLLLGGEAVRVHGGVGSLVLWDSRTAHCNIAPERSTPMEQRKERCVVYVCMQPRAWCSKANLAKKARAFDNFRMTTHWPASKIELFPVNPRTYGQELTAIVPRRTRIETQRMREIAGAEAEMTSMERRTRQPGLAFQK